MTLDEDAARMIAEVVPPAGELATKTDLADLERHLDLRFAGIDVRFERIEARFSQLEAKLLRTTFLFFVPLWTGVLGTLVAMTVAMFTRP